MNNKTTNYKNYFIQIYIYMNKLKRKKFLAYAIDTDTIWVKCPIPCEICPYRLHEYNSNGVWNGNHKAFVSSSCFCNYGDDIVLVVNNSTLRTTIVDEIHKEFIFSRKLFKEKLKKHRKIEYQYLGKTIF